MLTIRALCLDGIGDRHQQNLAIQEYILYAQMLYLVGTESEQNLRTRIGIDDFELCVEQYHRCGDVL